MERGPRFVVKGTGFPTASLAVVGPLAACKAFALSAYLHWMCFFSRFVPLGSWEHAFPLPGLQVLWQCKGRFATLLLSASASANHTSSPVAQRGVCGHTASLTLPPDRVMHPVGMICPSTSALPPLLSLHAE